MFQPRVRPQLVLFAAASSLLALETFVLDDCSF